MPIEIDRRDLIRWVITALLTLVSLVAIVGAGWALVRGKSPVDNALAEVRRLPLIGTLMDEDSTIASRMRKAIEDEVRKPTEAGGLSRPYSLIADLKRQYIQPAMRAADDTTALAAVAARANFVRVLRRTDTAACRQFALGTLQRPDLLGPEGSRAYQNYQQALEAAYRNGKAAGKPQRVLTRDELTVALRQAGFAKLDFDRLQTFQGLSNEISCDVELKVDSTPANLPPVMRSPLARYILAN